MVRAGFLALALLAAALGLAGRAAAGRDPPVGDARSARPVGPAPVRRPEGRAARNCRGAGRRRQRRRHRRPRDRRAPLRRRSADEHGRGLGRVRDRQGRFRVRERRGCAGLPHRRRGTVRHRGRRGRGGRRRRTATASTTSSSARRSPMMGAAQGRGRRVRRARPGCHGSRSASPHPAAPQLVVQGTGRNDRLGSSVAALPGRERRRPRPISWSAAPRADRPDAGGDADQSYVSDAAVAQERRSRVRPRSQPGGLGHDSTRRALGAAGLPRSSGARGRAGDAPSRRCPTGTATGMREIAVGAPLYRRDASSSAAAPTWSGAAPRPRPSTSRRLGPRGIVLDGGGQQRARRCRWRPSATSAATRAAISRSAPTTRVAGPRGRAAGRVLIVYARSEPGSLELDELGDAGLRIDGESAGDHAGVADRPRRRRRRGRPRRRSGRRPRRRPAGPPGRRRGVRPLRRLGAPVARSRVRRHARLPDRGRRGGRAARASGRRSPATRAATAAPIWRSAARGRRNRPVPCRSSTARSRLSKTRSRTLPPDPGAEEEVAEDGCRAVTKLGVIVDDSGSMEEFDPGRLAGRRARAAARQGA